MILAELPLLLIEHSLVVITVIEFTVGLLVALNRDPWLPERSSAVKLPDALFFALGEVGLLGTSAKIVLRW